MSETTSATVAGTTTQYKVNTAGYTEQFTDYNKAVKAFEKARAKKIKEEETFKLTLSSREGTSGRWVTLDTVKIGEDYYAE
jgi:hypothetical protein